MNNTNTHLSSTPSPTNRLGGSGRSRGSQKTARWSPGKVEFVSCPFASCEILVFSSSSYYGWVTSTKRGIETRIAVDFLRIWNVQRKLHINVGRVRKKAYQGRWSDGSIAIGAQGSEGGDRRITIAIGDQRTESNQGLGQRCSFQLTDHWDRCFSRSFRTRWSKSRWSHQTIERTIGRFGCGE